MWEHQNSRSVKADDADIPVHLWDHRVWERPHDSVARRAFEAKFGRCPLEAIRAFLLRSGPEMSYEVFVPS
jgi:hypothetical protein